MKKFVYPAVLFADDKKNTKTILFPDLDIVATANSVERAFLEAGDFLKSYLEFAIKMESRVVPASTFDEVKMMNPKRIVLLVSAEVENSYQLTEEEQEYKNFVSQYLVDVEDEDNE